MGCGCGWKTNTYVVNKTGKVTQQVYTQSYDDSVIITREEALSNAFLWRKYLQQQKRLQDAKQGEVQETNEW